ncbi:MFS transporter [Pseudomonas phoenicis]|uniref:MFS transporter n=1 Tax=unclassified Pseudomonas TaxID=196821 RepID=UPI00399FFC6F
MSVVPTASHKGRHCVLVAICLAALALPFSFTGGAVATPAIGKALAANPAWLGWITNAFMLSFGSLLMVAGSLADIYGRRRLFVYGLAALALTSLSLAMASSIAWLVALRALQGVAGAATLASGSAALAQVFTGQARARAFSLLGSTFGLGLAFGPLIGALLLEHGGWRAVFAIPAVLAAVSLLGAWFWMHESRDEEARRIDLPGAASFTLMLVLLTLAIMLGPQSGWTAPWICSLLVGAASCLVAFVLIELYAEQPMLDLTLFKYPRFLGVQLLPVGTCYCYIVLIVLLAYRLNGVEGLAPLHSGLIMLALSAPMLIVPLLAAWLTRWVSAGALCAAGFLLAAAGLFLLAHVDAGARPSLLVAMLMVGVGTAFPWGLMDGLALGTAPPERAGRAAGIFNTTRVAGEGVALATTLALLTALVTDALEPWVPAQRRSEIAQRLIVGDLDSGIDPCLLRAAYLQGFDSLLLVLCGITVLIALLTFLLLGHKRANASVDPIDPPARVSKA